MKPLENKTPGFSLSLCTLPHTTPEFILDLKRFSDDYHLFKSSTKNNSVSRKIRHKVSESGKENVFFKSNLFTKKHYHQEGMEWYEIVKQKTAIYMHLKWIVGNTGQS